MTMVAFIILSGALYKRRVSEIMTKADIMYTVRHLKHDIQAIRYFVFIVVTMVWAPFVFRSWLYPGDYLYHTNTYTK